jgi:hypothetical protein
VTLTLPALDEISTHYPKARVFYATKTANAPVVRYHPVLEKVLTLEGSGPVAFFRHLAEIKRLAPHVVVDLHDSLRTRLLRFFLRKLRFKRWATYHQARGGCRRAWWGAQDLRARPPYGREVCEGAPRHRHQANGLLPLNVPGERRDGAGFVRDFCYHGQNVRTSDWVWWPWRPLPMVTKQWPEDNWPILARPTRGARRHPLVVRAHPARRVLIESIRTRMATPPAKRGLVLAGEGGLERPYRCWATATCSWGTIRG